MKTTPTRWRRLRTPLIVGGVLLAMGALALVAWWVPLIVLAALIVAVLMGAG